MWSVSVQVSSIKKRSCDTTMMMREAQVGLLVISWQSHSTACMLRWFVGSSKKRMSGLANSAAAKATRTRQPPLKAFIGRVRSSSLKPRFARRRLARTSAVEASMLSNWLRTARYCSLSLATSLPSSFLASSSKRRRSTSAATTISEGAFSIAPSESFTSWET
mmetsp:Transcript_114429/g.323496  ORF Transcript_114429/g.323496 Transcript_114429/m.323496 type:complete len:163 (-) Transcript_114429:776-1264(-)